MYPPPTSFIPVQIALTRFLENQGWKAIFTNYPYWYMGTTPYRYLTGPILPVILTSLHKISPFSLFEVMYILIAISGTLGAVGVYFLVKTLKGTENSPEGHRIAILTAFFYFFGPIVPFLFRFSDGLSLIAFSFVPYILLLYLRFLEKSTKKRKIILVLAISFLFLLDTKIISRLILAMAAVFLTQVGWKKGEVRLRQTFSIFIFPFLFSTIWYSPGYWWTLLKSPSFAGKPAWDVIFWLGKLMPTAFAFTLAIISHKFFKTKDKLRDFCFYWLFIFSFLTLIRFLSDPDFWLDWSVYGTELQLGLSVLGGLMVNRFLERGQYQILNSKYQNDRAKFKKIKTFLILICHFAFCILIFTFIFNKYVLNTFQKDITRSVEYRIGKELLKIVKPGETVFLSGSTAFWLNTFFDIPQVRGGVDQASVDPNWRKAVWEIREGTTSQKALEWLRKIKVDYLVVHTEESKEFYHDFLNPEKFENIKPLKKIFDQGGDRIYQVQQ